MANCKIETIKPICRILPYFGKCIDIKTIEDALPTCYKKYKYIFTIIYNGVEKELIVCSNQELPYREKQIINNDIIGISCNNDELQEDIINKDNTGIAIGLANGTNTDNTTKAISIITLPYLFMGFDKNSDCNYCDYVFKREPTAMIFIFDVQTENIKMIYNNKDLFETITNCDDIHKIDNNMLHHTTPPNIFLDFDTNLITFF